MSLSDCVKINYDIDITCIVKNEESLDGKKYIKYI